MLLVFLRGFMRITCVVGILWGDEGKGKVIDFLAEEADYVARFGGGHNAGHTLVLPSGKLVLHLVPSGIVHPGVVNVIGNGVVIDPIHLVSEIRGLRGRGIDVELGRNLLISERAHVIVEAHRLEDQWHEKKRGKGRIGTTGRGIGPAYADRAGRVGIRMGDLVRAESLRAGVERLLAEKNALFEAVGLARADGESLVQALSEAGAELAPGIADTGLVLRKAAADGRRILLEGAQGVLLDVEHGTYPFVTSSHSSTGGAFSGTGLPPGATRIIGVAKAYATRVGEGPFPTELTGEMGERLRAAGNEFGSTTGRPRRCGWFDAVAVRYSGAVAGVQSLVITNLDVLRGFEELLVADRYEAPDGRAVSDFPAFDLDLMTPRYEAFPGFEEDITEVRTYGALPKAARRYIEAIEEFTGLGVEMISVGPRREQVIQR
ncbi:MAG: adenylosuccinate synthase [Planctomycetota bacterium]